MTKKNEFKLRLNIYGYQCPADEITGIIGINPSKVWLEGEPVIPRALNTHKENGWRICSPLGVNQELIEHWNELEKGMKIIASKRNLLPPEVEIELSCVIFAYEYIPSIYFERRQIVLLDKLEAEIDIDLYSLME